MKLFLAKTIVYLEKTYVMKNQGNDTIIYIFSISIQSIFFKGKFTIYVKKITEFF